MLRVGVLIPAYNEAESIARVLTDLPQTLVSDVVVDNGSTACASATLARSAPSAAPRSTVWLWPSAPTGGRAR